MRRKDDSDEILRCSFCGKNEHQVKKLVAGPGVYICDECIKLCVEIIGDEIEEDPRSDKDFSFEDLPKPKEIAMILDEYVIGQEEAKKTLAVAVYNHYKRIQKRKRARDVELQKSNILMLGPTGCGKTLLAQTLAKILHVPFAIADATSLTEAGYVGEDVENILSKLIQAADGDIATAERGIVYIDEIDKIARHGEGASVARDVSGEGVQQALLKILEGTVANVPPAGGKRFPHQELVQIDTSNILFICGGAFDGLEKVIERRTTGSQLGFGADVKSKNNKQVGEILKEVLPEDLLKSGLIPEFVGRLPIVVTLDSLDEESLVRILTQPKDALVKQYQRLMEMDGAKLKFEPDALELIAKEALTRKTGARGLRSILEGIMRNVMFEVPSIEGVTSCTITRDVVKNKKDPILVMEKSAARTRKTATA